MAFRIDQSKCIKCEACIVVCPMNCISNIDGDIIINEELCISCGACNSVCPVDAPNEVEGV